MVYLVVLPPNPVASQVLSNLVYVRVVHKTCKRDSFHNSLVAYDVLPVVYVQPS